MRDCCSKYSSRDLRQVVSFERLVRTSDGAGGFAESWAPIAGAPTRAKVSPMSGRERWSSQRIEATATHMVVTRYYADLSEKDRIVIRNRPCQVRFINNLDYMNHWLEIAVEMGVAT